MSGENCFIVSEYCLRFQSPSPLTVHRWWDRTLTSVVCTTLMDITAVEWCCQVVVDGSLLSGWSTDSLNLLCLLMISGEKFWMPTKILLRTKNIYDQNKSQAILILSVFSTREYFWVVSFMAKRTAVYLLHNRFIIEAGFGGHGYRV